MQHPPAKPRWAKWQSIPVVDLWQGVALSMDYEPDDIQNLNWGPSGGPEFDLGIVFKDRLEVAVSNVQYGELRNALAQRQVGVPEYAKVKLPAFADWALSIGWDMSDGMREIAKRAQAREAFAFDPEDVTYPPELDAAFIAWRAVSRRRSPNMSPKKQLIEWLKEHNPSLSDEARERIATVCNWQRTGGKPRA